MKPSLQTLISALKARETDLHLEIGEVLAVRATQNEAFCDVEFLSDDSNITCQVASSGAGDNAGIYFLPQIGDLVIIGCMAGSIDYAYIIARVSTEMEKIPMPALAGHAVVRSRPGKHTWVSGDRVNISKGDSVPSEGLVLGEQFVAYASEMLQGIVDSLAGLQDAVNGVITAYNDHEHIAPSGGGTTTSPEMQKPVAPAPAAKVANSINDLKRLKSSPIDDKMILSNIAFTERVEEDAAE